MKKYKKYQTFFGLLVLSVLAALFTYRENKPLRINQLAKVNVTLKEKPRKGEEGGGMTESFIEILIEKSKKKFYLNSCSYYSAQRKKILQLEPGREVTLLISKWDIKKKRINVYEFEVNGTKLLSLEDYNYCYTKKWRIFIPFIYVFLSIIVIMVLYDLWRYFKNKNTRLKTY